MTTRGIKNSKLSLKQKIALNKRFGRLHAQPPLSQVPPKAMTPCNGDWLSWGGLWKLFARVFRGR